MRSGFKDFTVSGCPKGSCESSIGQDELPPLEKQDQFRGLGFRTPLLDAGLARFTVGLRVSIDLDLPFQ